MLSVIQLSLSKMMLSVKIPSNEDLFEKNFYVYGNKEKPILKDNSLWCSAVYEVWDSQKIYVNLYFSIRQFVVDIECAILQKDFSEKTSTDLELMKNLIIEGVRYCGVEKNSLLGDLKQMIDMAKKYLEEKKKLKMIMKMVENLSERLRQLQVDVESAIFGFFYKCHCQQCDDYAEFYKERSDIKKEMRYLQKNGANKDEIKRLHSLLKGAKIEMREYKNLWDF